MSPRGSDSGPGTRVKPWRTLEHAALSAPAGSTVNVEAGSYGQMADTTPLTWTAVGGKVTVSVGAGSPVFSVTTGALSVRGFSFVVASSYKESLVTLEDNASLLFAHDSIQGSLSSPALVGWHDAGSVRVTSVAARVSGPGDSFLAVGGSPASGPVTLSGCRIAYSGSRTRALVTVYGPGRHRVLIEKNYFASGRQQFWPDVLLEDQPGVQVTDNHFWSADLDQLAELLVHSTGSPAGSPLIQGNYFRSASRRNYVIEVGSDGAAPGNGLIPDARIEDNTIVGPYYLDPKFSARVTTHAIIFGYSANGMISGNTVKGEGYGVVVKGDGFSYTSGGVLGNTLINDKGEDGITIKGVQHVPVENNAIYSDGTIGFANVLGVRVEVNPEANGDPATNTTIEGNTISGRGAGALMSADPASAVGLMSDHNSFCQSVPGPVAIIDPKAYTPAQWRAAGHDKHSTFGSSCKPPG